MKTSVQQAFGPMEVKRFDEDQGAKVKKVDVAEIPLEVAKAQIGRAVSKVIRRTDAVLKDFGDPGLVKRVCDGEVPSVIARAWQRRDRRREFLRALIEEEASVEQETIYRIKESA